MADFNIKSLHGNIASVFAERKNAAQRLKAERISYAEERLPGYKELSGRIREKGLLLGKLAFRGKNSESYKNVQSELENLISEKEKLAEKLGEGFFDDVYTCDMCKDEGFLADESGNTVRCRCYKQLLADMLAENFELVFSSGDVNIYKVTN